MIHYNDPEENKRKKQERLIAIIAAVVLAFLIVWGALSCKRVEYVTQTKVEYRDRLKIDSIYIEGKDSIIEKYRHDTLVIERWRTDYVSKYIFEHDTIAKIDSIPYPVEVTKVVKKSSGFSKFCIAYFIVTLVLAVGYIALKIYLKFYKR